MRSQKHELLPSDLEAAWPRPSICRRGLGAPGAALPTERQPTSCLNAALLLRLVSF